MSTAARAAEPSSLPPFVYLPVAPGATADAAEVELRPLTDGRVALLAYTALDRLESCCGPHQAWTVFPVGDLEAVAAAQPYDVVLVDQPLPPEARHTGPDAS